MAKEPDETQETESNGGGKKTIIIFALVALVAVGAGVGGTMMFLGGGEAEAVETAEVESDKPAPAIYHSLRPPFIVNYNAGTKPRMLQAELTIMARNPGVVQALVDHSPLVRSRIVNYLTDQDFFALQTHEGKESLRAGLRDMVDDVLRESAGVNGVQSVLLTNFEMQ